MDEAKVGRAALAAMVVAPGRTSGYVGDAHRLNKHWRLRRAKLTAPPCQVPPQGHTSLPLWPKKDIDMSA